jgi:hypothetical protein
VRRQPDHPVAQFDLGVVYQTMGMKEEARAHYLKAKSLDAPPEMTGRDRPVARAARREGQPEGLPPGHPAVP